MLFSTLLNESRDYLKRKGYLSEEPAIEEDEESTEESPVGEAGGEEGGASAPDLSWLDDPALSGGPGDSAPASGGGASPPPSSGGGGDMPAGDESQGEGAPTGQDNPVNPDEKSIADTVLPDPSQEVLSNEARLRKTQKILQKLLDNTDNAEINKAETIDEVNDNLAGLLNTDEAGKKEVGKMLTTRFRDIIPAAKKVAGAQVDPTNPNVLKLGENINALRTTYIKG